MFLTCLTVSLSFLFSGYCKHFNDRLPTKKCFKIGVKKIAHSIWIFREAKVVQSYSTFFKPPNFFELF